MKKIFYLYALSILLIFLSSCSNNREIKLLILNENQKNVLSNILVQKNYNSKIIEKDGYLIIENVNQEMLIDFLLIINLKLEIISDNIANENTTRTYESSPFLRKYLKISPEDGMEIIVDTISPTRLVWDPSHPDAIRSGSREGYVEYPNVDIAVETIDLIAYTNLQKIIIEYLREIFNIYVL